MIQHSVGDRVSREIDIYDPKKGLKLGEVIKHYSRPREKYGDWWLGPYPNLYDVKWDDGSIGKAFLPHGINPA